ncbi:MAG: hypothetical protein U9R39_06660 [Campylobacterota bacterium]|nr:hypothetical protein [Campylobacterota bacterium]
MLHQQLLQQQLSQESNKSLFNDLPQHIMSTLDNMAFSIAQKENTDSFEVKQKLVTNINNLSPNDIDYLINQMSILIDKSVNNEETINDENVEKEFISFLIRLYY